MSEFIYVFAACLASLSAILAWGFILGWLAKKSEETGKKIYAVLIMFGAIAAISVLVAGIAVS